MIGGFYITALEPSASPPAREFLALVAGPFATQADANASGKAAFDHVNRVYKDAKKLQWGVCEFYFPRLVLGTRNGELWVKANPIERQ